MMWRRRPDHGRRRSPPGPARRGQCGRIAPAMRPPMPSCRRICPAGSGRCAI